MITLSQLLQESVNIIVSQNSTVQTDPSDPSTKKPFCGLKIKFRSQSAGNSQSNDFIPVLLIATPGLKDFPRYGARSFPYYYPKGDALIIDYDNRVPDSINGEVYDIKNETIDICFNGKIYPIRG